MELDVASKLGCISRQNSKQRSNSRSENVCVSYEQRVAPLGQSNGPSFKNSLNAVRPQTIAKEAHADVVPRVLRQTVLEIVELNPYIEYIKYLLSGSLAHAMFVSVMISGGILYIDDKARGVFEGNMVPQITKAELVFGLNHFIPSTMNLKTDFDKLLLRNSLQNGFDI